MATALPHAVTGTCTTGDTWLPVATPALNPVSALAAPAEAALPAPPAAQPDDCAKPSRAIELPHPVNGAPTTAAAWLPLSTPAFWPAVIAEPPPGAVAPALAAPPALALLPDPPPLL